MLGKRATAVLSILVLVFTPLATSTPSGAACPKELEVLGECDVDNTGTDVVIDGTDETDGGPGTDGTDGTDGEWQPPGDDGTEENPFDFDECLEDWEAGRQCYRPDGDDEDTDGTDGEPEVPTITITDLVRFTPEGSVITGEPDNVGVVGLPTNFVTTAAVQDVAGELFGIPITVRFTPAGYDFAYGDGATNSTTHGGASWISLGQAQFTPTDTGHTYSARGTYIAQVDVRYTAEVDFGIGWIPINGTVTAAGAPQEIRIFEAHTALVAHTCAQAPSSPGC